MHMHLYTHNFPVSVRLSIILFGIQRMLNSINLVPMTQKSLLQTDSTLRA